MSQKAATILKLFDRPTEPSFMPKGDDNSVFESPSKYLNDRFKPLKNDLDNRFGSSNKIQVKDITLPDLSLPETLPRRANFSLFIPSHRKMAARLIEVLVGMRSLDDFLAAAVYCHDRMNSYMFIYALSVAVLHRPDTQGLQIPSLCEVFPDKYMDRALLSQAREELNIIPQESRVCSLSNKCYNSFVHLITSTLNRALVDLTTTAIYLDYFGF